MKQGRPIEWLPIPSLDGKYEINEDAQIRNAATQQILRPFKQGCRFRVSLQIDKKKVNRSVRKLYLEAYGFLPKHIYYDKKRYRFSDRAIFEPIPTRIENGIEQYRFRSLRQTAYFLETRLFLSHLTLQCYFSQRIKWCYGWKIEYFCHNPLFRK